MVVWVHPKEALKYGTEKDSAVRIIGMTISWAGKAKRKAKSMIPLRPISRAGRSRKQMKERKIPGKKYAVSHTAETVGNMIAMDRIRAGRTCSRRARRSVLWTMGQRRGGNSNVKEEPGP